MQIDNLFLRIPHGKVGIISPDNFTYFYKLHNDIILENGDIIDNGFVDQSNFYLYHVPSFIIDPLYSKLITFTLLASENNNNHTLLFQINNQGTLQQLNTISANNKEFTIIKVSFLDVYELSFPRKINLKSIPKGIIDNIFQLVQDTNNIMNIKFILSLKSVTHLSLGLTKNQQIDIQILSDLNYDKLIEYAKYDLYVEHILQLDEFYMEYISKNFNREIMMSKFDNMNYKQYYEFIMKIITPILNPILFNTLIDNSISDQSLQSNDNSIPNPSSLRKGNHFHLFRYILDIEKFRIPYQRYIEILVELDEIEQLILRICRTKNSYFFHYFISLTEDYIDYNVYTPLYYVIQVGDVDFYNEIKDKYSWGDDNSQYTLYFNSIKSGNIDMISNIIQRYNINQRELMVDILTGNNLVELFSHINSTTLQLIFGKKNIPDLLNPDNLKINPLSDNDKLKIDSLLQSNGNDEEGGLAPENFLRSLNIERIYNIFQRINYNDPDVEYIVNYLLMEIFHDMKMRMQNFIPILHAILNRTSIVGNINTFKYYFQLFIQKYEYKINIPDRQNRLKYLIDNNVISRGKYFSNAVSNGHLELMLYLEEEFAYTTSLGQKMLYIPNVIPIESINDYYTLNLHLVPDQPNRRVYTQVLAFNSNNLHLFDVLQSQLSNKNASFSGQNPKDILLNDFSSSILPVTNSSSTTISPVTTSTTPRKDRLEIANSIQYYISLINFDRTKILDREINSSGFIPTLDETDGLIEFMTNAQYFLFKYLTTNNHYVDDVIRHMIINYDIFHDPMEFLNIFMRYDRSGDDDIILQLIKEEYISFDHLFHIWNNKIIKGDKFKYIVWKSSSTINFISQLLRNIFTTLNYDLFTALDINLLTLPLSLSMFLELLMSAIYNPEFQLHKIPDFQVLIRKFSHWDDYLEIGEFSSNFYRKLNEEYPNANNLHVNNLHVDNPNVDNPDDRVIEEVNILPVIYRQKYKILYNFKSIMKILMRLIVNSYKFLEMCHRTHNDFLLKYYIETFGINDLIIPVITNDNIDLFIIFKEKFNYVFDEETLFQVVLHGSVKILDYLLYTLHFAWNPSLLSLINDESYSHSNVAEKITTYIIPYLESKVIYKLDA